MLPLSDFAVMTSAYVSKLPVDALERYKKKINLFLADVDPFLLLEKKTHQSELPPVDASDLVSYLVLQTSYLTAKQFKSHKSLEAYNQFVSGWVKEVVAWSVAETNKLLVTGRVIVDTI